MAKRAPVEGGWIHDGLIVRGKLHGHYTERGQARQWAAVCRGEKAHSRTVLQDREASPERRPVVTCPIASHRACGPRPAALHRQFSPGDFCGGDGGFHFPSRATPWSTTSPEDGDHFCGQSNHGRREANVPRLLGRDRGLISIPCLEHRAPVVVVTLPERGRPWC